MSTRSPFPPPGFDELPVEEKLKYVQSLWDRIAEEPDKVLMADWQRGALRERREARQSIPDDGLDSGEVLGRIRRSLVEDQVTMLLQHALQLPPEARAALASLLLESLDETVDENAEAEWAVEIARRLQELDEGLV